MSECKHVNLAYVNNEDCYCCPDCCEWFDVIKKPKQKVIDLSMMVGSVDMEFSDNNIDWHIGKLHKINGNGTYYKFKNMCYRYCRIRQDHSHANVWDKCPLPEGLEVSITYNQGGMSGRITDYSEINWREVSRFYVLGPADDWIYEWQKEKEE